MSENFEQKGNFVVKMSKKMSKKSTCQIPLDALGFKAKVFYDATYEYIPRRKQNKYAKYEKQKRQQNFRQKLSCIIDPSHATYQQIGDLKFNKRSEWKKIKYVVYRTKQLLTCCICLTKEFIAPQMTYCGHVFCWHCILMHHEKSLKANYCPVCNQVFEIQQLRTCDTLYLLPISQGEKIKLRLKIRNIDQKITYNPQNLQQQTTFSHIVRMKNTNTLQKFMQQNEQIIKQMQHNDDPQSQKYLGKVLEKSQARIQNLRKNIEQQKGNHYKTHKHETFFNGTLCHVLLPQELMSQKITAFYQQQSGRSMFLHPICEKYLRKNFTSQSLPYKLEQQVILKQQTQYSGQNIKKYKYLNHLPENQQIDFVFIRMNELLDYRLLEQFQKQLELYKKKRHQIAERQEQYAKLLNEKYQKQQEYMRQLKKMQQSMFHDIKVPINMVDLSQIQDTNVFPSLVSVVSDISEFVSMSDSTSQVSGYTFESTKSKNKGKKNQFKLKQQDFPGLELAIKMSMQDTSKQQQIHVQSHINRTQSENPNLNKQKNDRKKSIIQSQSDFPDLSSKIVQKKSQKTMITLKPKRKNQDQQQQQGCKVKRKGKKKNKEKFVDVTHQFFSRQQEDD